jgi:hypothetical protein
MANNEKFILNKILETDKQNYSPEISDSDYFEIFSFEQIMKNYDLSSDDLNDGNIDGGGDGGVDGFFTFLNGELLSEDTELGNIKRNPKFDLFIIQAKTTDSFSELAVEHVTATIKHIFDLSRDIKELRLYNTQLVEKVDIFRNAFGKLLSLHPILSIKFIYTTKGNIQEIHPNVLKNADLLKSALKELFRNSKADVEFIGAKELLDLYNIRKDYTLQIQFHESYISTAADNYIILSNLADFYEFVTDDNRQLQRHIFESNVRDYQGDVEVNKDIFLTLKTVDNLDFWWLNNGITILASTASIAGKKITLDNVQIVNGLQTTMEIAKYFDEKGRYDDPQDKKRSILVRIIVTDDPEIRDRIIKATNFQTRIPPPSLRATDRIQRNIETFFLTEGWFYDRRKNYYKNIGKPSSKIIGIPLLSQVLMAIILREPYQARSRPTALIKSEEDYNKLFNETTSPEIYLLCAKIIKKIESSIRSKFPQHVLALKTSFKFHASMVLMIQLTKKKNYSLNHLTKNLFDEINDEMLSQCFDVTINSAQQFSRDTGWDLNRISKNKDFDDYLIKAVNVEE